LWLCRWASLSSLFPACLAFAGLGDKSLGSCPIRVIAPQPDAVRQSAVAWGNPTSGSIMDIQSLYRFGYDAAFLTGIAGGCFAHRFRPSGKRALAIALVPLMLVLARAAVITVAKMCDITGVGELFC
jgi:hypothetical protein